MTILIITLMVTGYLSATVLLGLFGGRRNDALAEKHDRERQRAAERLRDIGGGAFNHHDEPDGSFRSNDHA